jgi:hypothetical protein
MSKTKQERLQRLESLVSIVSAATSTLRAITQGIQYLRTSIAGAQTINIPAATGKSGQYNIFIGVTASGNKVIKAASTSLFQGIATMAGGTPGSFASAANTNTITLNGTTQGGIIGTVINLRDVAPGIWATEVKSVGSGIQVTPFSNT